MKSFLCAISFLTRFPISPNLIFEAKDVGKASIYFPLVGAILGSLQFVAVKGFEFAGLTFETTFKAILLAILLLIINTLATGALHFDGLADMADGFGGGLDKENVLRIMRDHVIGTYGGMALILLILLKVTAIASLIQNSETQKFLIIAPMLGRWATVPLGKFMPYARSSGGLGNSITDFVGWRELFGATLISAAILFYLADWRISLISGAFTILTTLYIAKICIKKIGGVTGDTLGANTEICEAFVLLIGVFWA